ncbi:MAG TPA: hypothetical protein VOA87_01095 [Thermoanaerobaculia bacterium]|nr:hypothetical protein [Thermoanaerobaculia bacterium]
MRKIVIASGVWNLGLGALMLCPALDRAIWLWLPNPFWGYLLCAFLWFTSVVLFLAARNLRARASFVYWEAFLRYAAAILMLTIGPAQIGPWAYFVGITDALWGLSYTFGLPCFLETTHRALLCDEVPAAP